MCTWPRTVLRSSPWKVWELGELDKSVLSAIICLTRVVRELGERDKSLLSAIISLTGASHPDNLIREKN